MTRERSQALAEVQGFLHERVQGISVLKSFAIEDNEAKNFDKKNTNFLTRALKHTRWNAYSFAAINTVRQITNNCHRCWCISCYFWINHSRYTCSICWILELLFGPLRRLVASFTTLTQSFASMDRVFQLIDEDYDIKNGVGAQPIEIKQGRIDIHHVSFQYNDNEAPILKDINLSIEKEKQLLS